ncbi:hypothetical protein V2J09_000088 [Rumex salicifolius]
MAPLGIVTAPLLRRNLLYCLKPIYPSCSRNMPSTPLSISITAPQPMSSSTSPHLNVSTGCLLIIPFKETFGCLCYPFLRPYTTTKLEFRSSPCIFIGYSSKHKGYICLDVPTRCVYIARLVIFNESTFPYPHHAAPSPPTPSPLPKIPNSVILCKSVSTGPTKSACSSSSFSPTSLPSITPAYPSYFLLFLTQLDMVLHQNFSLHDLGDLHFFLSIVLQCIKQGIILSHQK